MPPETVAIILNTGIILLSALAAAAWLRSAKARVKVEASKPGGFEILVGEKPGDHSFVVDRVDVIATTALQTKWNTRAAWMACGAAACQALQTLLPLAKTIGLIRI